MVIGNFLIVWDIFFVGDVDVEAWMGQRLEALLQVFNMCLHFASIALGPEAVIEVVAK